MPNRISCAKSLNIIFPCQRDWAKRMPRGETEHDAKAALLTDTAQLLLTPLMLASSNRVRLTLENNEDSHFRLCLILTLKASLVWGFSVRYEDRRRRSDSQTQPITLSCASRLMHKAERVRQGPASIRIPRLSFWALRKCGPLFLRPWVVFSVVQPIVSLSSALR